MVPPAGKETRAKAARPTQAAALALALSTLAAYALTLAGPLIYDDRVWITGNPYIRHLGSLGRVLFPPGDSPARGRPVLSLSFALNYALGGNDPWGYHLLNLAIHVLAALVLFGIIRRTLAHLPRAFPTERDRLFPAFSAALLWALHPIQTEAVTYVSQRAESLMGLFYLMALYAFIRAVNAPGTRIWDVIAVSSCLLGMATKEAMVTAPLAILAYDRTFVSGGFRKALGSRMGLYAGLFSTWLPLGFLALGLGSRGVGYGFGYSWWTYGLVEAWVVVHYLLLALWPFPLVFDYGTGVVGTLHDTLPWACALLVIGAAALVAFLRRGASGFAGVAFLLLLAPSSSFVPVAFQPMAEHRMYLPLAALTALASAWAWARLGRRSVPVVVAMALALGTATLLRNRDYRSEVTIWDDTVKWRPSNERARLALGNALSLERRDSEAAGQFAEAIRIAPWDYRARLCLGLSLFKMGREAEALLQYDLIAAPTPDSALLHSSRAMALDRLGRTAEAALEYGKALALDPTDGRARLRLGQLGARPVPGP